MQVEVYDGRPLEPRLLSTRLAIFADRHSVGAIADLSIDLTSNVWFPVSPDFANELMLRGHRRDVKGACRYAALAVSRFSRPHPGTAWRHSESGLYDEKRHCPARDCDLDLSSASYHPSPFARVNDGLGFDPNLGQLVGSRDSGVMQLVYRWRLPWWLWLAGWMPSWMSPLWRRSALTCARAYVWRHWPDSRLLYPSSSGPLNFGPHRFLVLLKP